MRPFRQRIWAMPIALGLISAVGLAAALLFDTRGNMLSWLALLAVAALSLLVCVRALSPRPSARRPRNARS